MKKIRPIDSGPRIPLRTDARTHTRTHAQGASDNHTKFSIENCQGAIIIMTLFLFLTGSVKLPAFRGFHPWLAIKVAQGTNQSQYKLTFCKVPINLSDLLDVDKCVTLATGKCV